MTLSEAVRQQNFEDALNTWTSPACIGPPTVEFAPYGRIPSGRRRTDARQGTIDQDPEFMDFLESLINPVTTKDNPEDSSNGGTAEKVTTTPLVQFLKEKKANKGKEAAASKAAKHARQDGHGSKTIVKSGKDVSGSAEDGKKSAKELRRDRLVEKATREAVRVLNKETTGKKSSVQPSGSAPSASEQTKPLRAAPRERGSIAAAAKILQRDLGLSPGNAHRKAKENAANAERAATQAQGGSSQVSGSTASSNAAPPSSRGRGSSRNAGDKSSAGSKDSSASGPVNPVILKKPTESATPTSLSLAPEKAPEKATNKTPAPSRKAPQAALPSSGATRAFVKHANPSQGVTEPLLKEAMEAFGAVSHVEIDKRKGFAYVDFVEPAGLKKAMAANPTKIAEGTVQVLERKDVRPAREAPSGPSARGGSAFSGRGGRGTGGGRRGGRGGGGGRGGAAAQTGASNNSAAPPPPPTAAAASAASK